MEDVFRGEKQACPCSKGCQEFYKLLELKKSGLVVYRYRPRAEDAGTPSLIRQGEAVGVAVNPSEDVFIIYKNKNVKITASELTSELEKKNISCPRCRKIFEHAQEVLQDVKSIDRKIVMGICDHCRKKSQTTEKPFCDCDQIIKKISRPSLKDHKREEIFKDVPSLDAKEALKRRHDLSLRQMMRLYQDTDGPHFVSKRPEVYETPKISSWEQMETISEKYHVKSKTDVTKIPTKTKSKQDRSAPNRQLQLKPLRTTQRNIKEPSKRAESGLNKQAESDKILQVKKERLEMEALKKQTKKEEQEKERLEMEARKKQAKEKKQEQDATSKKEKQKNDATSKKAKQTKKSGRDSSDKITMPKINEFSKDKEVSRKAQKGELKMSKTKIKKRHSSEILKSIRIEQKKPLSLDSELDLDVSLEMKKNPPKQKTDIIIGENIVKCRPHLEKTKKLENVPIFFQKDFFAEPDHRTEEAVQIIPKEAVQITPKETKPVQIKHIPRTQSTESDTIKVDPGKGVLCYALSDRTFIDKGWTILPTEKVVRKMNVYRMRPAHPEFDWFEHNKNNQLMTYDTGERLAEFDDNGRGRWYYRNGRLALDYYDAEETNAQQRFVIYSSGEPDERGRTHPITILATFDHLGNGIVFDHAGKIRLKYNQTEGVVLDRAIGPSTHWQWHSLNDPPVLQQVMIDTQLSHKDPNILNLESPATKIPPINADMLAIEFDNFIKEKSKKLSQKFKPFQIKMKAMKINEHFSLKILDQATIYLIYRDGTTNMKLNIGMLLDDTEIVDTDTSDLGKVSNSLERFPARTDSLAILQASVANAQRHESKRINRERILRPQEPCASANILAAAASPPMRLPLITVSTGSSSSIGQCTGHCSRKPTQNLYYNTRFLF